METMRPHEGTEPGKKKWNFFRPSTKELPSFARETMLPYFSKMGITSIGSLGDGKFKLYDRRAGIERDFNLRELDPVRVKKLEYNIRKQALQDTLTGAGRIISGSEIYKVRKVDGTYYYLGDHGDGDGLKEHSLSIDNASDKEHLEKIEKQISDLGFSVRDKFMSQRLENAVLEHAAKDFAESGKNGNLIKEGWVEDYDAAKNVWTIGTIDANGKEQMHQFAKLDKDAIEEEARINGFNEHVDGLSGKIEDFRYNEKSDAFEILYEGGGPNDWKEIKMDAETMKKIDDGAEISKITFDGNEIPKKKAIIDQSEFDDILKAKEAYYKSYRRRMRIVMAALNIMGSLDNAAKQEAADIGAAMEQLLKMGGGENGMNPTNMPTEKTVDAVRKHIDHHKRMLKLDMAAHRKKLGHNAFEIPQEFQVDAMEKAKQQGKKAYKEWGLKYHAWLKDQDTMFNSRI